MVADIASRGAECPSDTGSFIGMFQHVSLYSYLHANCHF